MSNAPILLIGGAGVVGRHAANYLRDAYPDAPLLIVGRNRAKAQKLADKIGNATAAQVDLTRDDLGLGDQPVSAMAALFTDTFGATLRFAQNRSIGHISISPAIIETGPDIAAYMTAPDASPVVLGTEWLVGATTIPTLEIARQFGRVDDIEIGALLDEQDDFGPAADVDYERQTQTNSAALKRFEGDWRWLSGNNTKTSFRAMDGTEIQAFTFSPNDVMALGQATGAANVHFRLALDATSARRAGGAPATEIIIELAGSDLNGKPLRTRHAVTHPKGQMPLTGLGVALVLERLAGLDGNPPTKPGLYFPYQLLDPIHYFARFRDIGGELVTLGMR
ncbi:hypothetical protein LPB41_29855 [Thalassospira sp. MA62]|nr:hypothetical protein [Thalassospira sp. MA62]